MYANTRIANLMLDLSCAEDEVLAAARVKFEAERSLLAAQMRLSEAKSAIANALNATAPGESLAEQLRGGVT